MIHSTREQRQQIKKENKKFPTNKFIWYDRDQWPRDEDPTRFKVGRNRDYLVQLFYEPDNIIRLSVNKTILLGNGRWDDGLTWDELQNIKFMAGFASSYAIEIYPSEDSIVNVANMRHLWILPKPLNIGWNQDIDT